MGASCTRDICSGSELYSRYLQWERVVLAIFAVGASCTRDICSGSELYSRYVPQFIGRRNLPPTGHLPHRVIGRRNLPPTGESPSHRESPSHGNREKESPSHREISITQLGERSTMKYTPARFIKLPITVCRPHRCMVLGYARCLRGGI